jgi:ABC-type transport system involved in multi-copper enzyme maturation permease subunit
LLADLQAPGSNYSGGWSRWIPVQGKSLNESLAIVLRDYVLTHALLSLILGGSSILRLRAVNAKQSPGITHKKKLILRPAPHPPIRERPVLWKELYCEAKPRQRWLRLFFGRWFFFASFLPIWFYMVLSLDNLGFSNLTTNTLFLLRYVGTFVVGLLCLRIAMHAARSIGGERDRQTLDSLLTTQLNPGEIILDKWWGSLLSGRWMFLWLLINWCLGMLPLALHPLAVPVLVLETMVYTTFAASLGIFFAVICHTTKRALTTTLLVGLIGTTFVPWAAGKYATIVIDPPRPVQNSLRQYPYYSEYDRAPVQNSLRQYPYYSEYDRAPTPWPERIGQGLVPPWVLANTVVPLEAYPFGSWLHQRDDHYLAEMIIPTAFGLVFYSGLSWALLWIAQGRFRESIAGHTSLRRRMPPNPPAFALKLDLQS